MDADGFQLPELGPAVDASAESASQRFALCAHAGFLRFAIDKRVGGFGNRFLDLVEVHKQLGYQTHDPGLVLALNAHLWGGVFPLLKFGSEAQQGTWLGRLLDGRVMAGHAITEPQAGSDINAIRATATAVDAGYVLNGRKRYITNTPIAGLMVVYAWLTEKDSISAFLVTPEDTGVEFAAGPTVGGCKTASMGDVILTDCLIPKERLLGKLGAGATMIQLALELERAFIFAGIIGVMNWQLEYVMRKARERRIGPGRLADVQAVAHKLAEMKLRLDTAELWVDRCARLCDAGKRITLASAQTKLFASEAFLQSSLDAVHILGAMGLESELPDLVNDAMAGRLFSGSSEIQKNIIGALLGVGGDGRRGR